MATRKYLDESSLAAIVSNVPKLIAGSNITLTPDVTKPNKITISSIEKNEIWAGTEFEYEQNKNDIPKGTTVLITDKKTVNLKLADGTLQMVADNTVVDKFIGSDAGLVPDSTTSDQTKLLRGDGTWYTPTAGDVTSWLGYTPATEQTIPVFSFDLSADGDLMMHTSDSGSAPVAYIAESGENKGCLMLDLG